MLSKLNEIKGLNDLLNYNYLIQECNIKILNINFGDYFYAYKLKFALLH